MGGVRRVLDQYHQLCDNLQEGVVFYTNLQDAISAVSKQCEDFVYSRNLQLKDMRVRAIKLDRESGVACSACACVALT